MKFKTRFTFLFAALIFISSCSVSDIRTSYQKKDTNELEQEQKGKALLEETWLAHGFDKLKNHTTYEVSAKDHWKGAMGKMGNLWGDSNNKPLKLRFSVGTFDNQVEFLEGKKAGTKAGLQSWNYYEKEEGGKAIFKKTKKRIGFGLAAYHYFFELADRLRRAPIIRYAGEKTFEGKEYDVVFATWETIKANPDYDQYQLYINKKTKLVDFCLYTIRESYLPGAKKLYGSIRYTDIREIDGIKVSFLQEVYINKPKALGKYLHQLKVTNFKFDSFPLSDLHPDKEIKAIGDDKPNSKVLGN